MKTFAIVVSLIALTLCFGETNFAQKKSRAKKQSGRIAKPVQDYPQIVMKQVNPPCKETEITYPYGAVAGEESKPLIVKKTCPPDSEASANTEAALNASVRILSKPKPAYTDAARNNQVTGTVSLKVSFLKSGAIGSVTPIRGLGYGLTEAAVKAAQQIKFEPAKEKGKPINSVITVDYKFDIY